jgi:transposase
LILTSGNFAPAHLRQDFQAISERQGESAGIGLTLLAQTKELFRLWRELRNEKLSWVEFQAAMEPVKAEVTQLLQVGKSCGHPKTETTCRNLLSLEASLWTFTRVPGIAAENNTAERPLRRALIWRRKSFGTQSKTGSQFVERILSVCRGDTKRLITPLLFLCSILIEQIFHRQIS